MTRWLDTVLAANEAFDVRERGRINAWRRRSRRRRVWRTIFIGFVGVWFLILGGWMFAAAVARARGGRLRGRHFFGFATRACLGAGVAAGLEAGWAGPACVTGGNNIMRKKLVALNPPRNRAAPAVGSTWLDPIA